MSFANSIELLTKPIEDYFYNQLPSDLASMSKEDVYNLVLDINRKYNYSFGNNWQFRLALVHLYKIHHKNVNPPETMSDTEREDLINDLTNFKNSYQN